MPRNGYAWTNERVQLLIICTSHGTCGVHYRLSTLSFAAFFVASHLPPVTFLAFQRFEKANAPVPTSRQPTNQRAPSFPFPIFLAGISALSAPILSFWRGETPSHSRRQRNQRRKPVKFPLRAPNWPRSLEVGCRQTVVLTHEPANHLQASRLTRSSKIKVKSWNCRCLHDNHPPVSPSLDLAASSGTRFLGFGQTTHRPSFCYKL